MTGVLLTFIFTNAFQGRSYIKINDTKYSIEFARTDEDKALGLGGRESLNSNAGMFFVFEITGFHVFWMKDMQFPLDIIWINEEFKIVDIERDVSPDDFPDRYVSQLPAKYVLEVNGGEVYNNGIQVGTTVKISGL